jgi:hypothetical protein
MTVLLVEDEDTPPPSRKPSQAGFLAIEAPMALLPDALRETPHIM